MLIHSYTTLAIMSVVPRKFYNVLIVLLLDKDYTLDMKEIRTLHWTVFIYCNIHLYDSFGAFIRQCIHQSICIRDTTAKCNL